MQDTPYSRMVRLNRVWLHPVGTLVVTAGVFSCVLADCRAIFESPIPEGFPAGNIPK